ncbi:SWIM zinc finger family protein [Pseudovibrio sp. Tun.PSC04-5.I4]|uniref:SWIM zinc finger family protein n=1 Tax=Pseudovibrio sp. Tun.PSC04-5.I4 TaxID=1798213 RepID=UPI00087FF837|nr:SWIM zinc finger family protein [Pseudovibrio sp. Tun.PSC04-5.I4]SDR45283.1 SWIM zinc finger [Pseudovibrio sp. Tun.PSC04-5.I4]
MSYGSFGVWGAPYISVAERRKIAEREIKKLRKKGRKIAPVTVEGRKIANTFWGKAWCDNLERYLDYETRLPRGRSCVRHSAVIDLQISPLKVKAMVSGSSIYDVTINIKALEPEQWQQICEDCIGGIDSLVELLQGKFSDAVMERICRQDEGLFPKPSQIQFTCSCPDWAYMCKHVAAAMYGVGARLDHNPELLFELRAVDQNDLVVRFGGKVPFSNQHVDAAKILNTDDMSALFGLDMEGDEDTGLAIAEIPERPTSPTPEKEKRARARKPGAKRNEIKKASAETAEVKPSAKKKTVRSKTVARPAATRVKGKPIPPGADKTPSSKI